MYTVEVSLYRTTFPTVNALFEDEFQLNLQK